MLTQIEGQGTQATSLEGRSVSYIIRMREKGDVNYDHVWKIGKYKVPYWA